MKKLASVFVVLALLSTVALALPVHAVDVYSGVDSACSGTAQDSEAANTAQGGSVLCDARNNNDNPVTGSDGIILRVSGMIAVFTAVVAVIVIIISGIRFALSGGEPKEVSNAKNTILYAVIGLVVIAIAQATILFVVKNI